MRVYGAEQPLVWPWLVVFLLSIMTCFLDIRRRRFFASAFVLVLLLITTIAVVYVDFFLDIQNGSRVGLLSPWIKITFLLVCSGFMYAALRYRFFQYRGAKRGQTGGAGRPG